MCSHHGSTECVIAYVFSNKFRETAEAPNKPTYFNDKCKFMKKMKMITIQHKYSQITVCTYVTTYKTGHVYICIHYTQKGGYAIKVQSE